MLTKILRVYLYHISIRELSTETIQWKFSGDSLINYNNIYTFPSTAGLLANDFSFKPISLKGFGSRVAVMGSQSLPYPAAFVFYEEYFEGRDVWSRQAILTPSSVTHAGPSNFAQGLGFDGTTVIAGSNFDDAVGLHSGSAFVFTGSWTVWTQTQKLVPSNTTDKGFGCWVTDWASPEINPYVLISASGTDDSDFFGGAVYSFRGFGSAAAAGSRDVGLGSSSAVVDSLGPVCNLPVGARAGQFAHLMNLTSANGLKATKPYPSSVTYSYWSELQRIESPNANDQNFGRNMRTYANIAVIGAPGVGGADQPTNANVYVYIRLASTAQWTFQEVLTAPAYSQWGQYLDIYGKYIVIGNTVEETNGVQDMSGAVYIYKQMSYSGSSVSYSLSQRLGQTGSVFFGVWVSMLDDSLWVGASSYLLNNDGKQFVYRLNGSDELWHLNQEFSDNLHLKSPADFVNVYVWGGGTFVTDNSPSAQYYSQFGNWSCLILTMADQFGDGWSGAKLQVTLPTNNPAGTQYFAPYCDTNNPYQLDFCPPGCAVGQNDTYSGLYTFSILNGSAVPFFWEIYWTVRLKVSGSGPPTVYTGAFNTTMTFLWDCVSHNFTFVSAVGLVPLNFTCVECASKSKSMTASDMMSLGHPVLNERDVTRSDQPAPSYFNTNRRLQQDTSSPTVSPTPTFDLTGPTLLPSMIPGTFPTVNTSSNSGAWLTLYDSSGEGGYEETGLGSQYFISDLTGSCLITSGTLCRDHWRFQCWEALDDGEYVIRFGGGADVHRGTQTWSFCGRTGGMQEQLVFTVVNYTCTPLELMSIVDYCKVRIWTI